jgi:HEAT repeat protein
MNEIDQLINELDTQGDNSAKATIAKLVAIGANALQSLMNAAKNAKKPRIQKWSLRALGEFRDPLVKPILLEAIRDKRMTIRLNALVGLGLLGDGAAIVPLLKDESPGVRGNAVDVIIRLGYKEAAKDIIPLLEDSQWFVRARAAEALGSFDEKKAVPALKKLFAAEENKAVVNALQKALNKLTN